MPARRKPDNIHKLNGTFQPCRHGDPDTKPEWNESFPRMPKCIDDDAKAEWKYIKSVVPDGVITMTDKTALAQYCVLWSEFKSDPVGFPSSKHAQLKLVQQELGFTPSSRGKIGGTPKKEEGGGSFGRT